MTRTDRNTVCVKKRQGGEGNNKLVRKVQEKIEDSRHGLAHMHTQKESRSLRSTLKSSGTAAYFMIAFLREAQLSG